MRDRRCLVLFTKPARPGRVKTRLIGALTAEQAAELHAAFVGDVAERLAAGRFRLEVAWALDRGETEIPERLPEVPLPEVPATSGAAPGPGFRQRGADLGERLFHGLARVARRFPAVAAVGSDHPELDLATVELAFERLEAGADVVIGPATDGGYYLIAVTRRALDPALFSAVPWSTDRVLSTTLERCRRQDLEVSLLPERPDVDTPEDLARLAERLAESEGGCPRTRAVLDGWRLAVR